MLSIEERTQFLNLFDALLNETQIVGEEMKVEDKGDEVDLISSERERSMVLRLQGRNSTYLRKIKEARNKLIAGEFGVCEECGAQISLARLKARPTAHLCIVCKEEEEKKESQMINRQTNDNILKFKNVKIISVSEKEIESIKAVSAEEFEEASDY